MSGVARVGVTWRGERRFETAREVNPSATFVLDGSGEIGPSPVEGLLGALASCAAVDVVDILAKRRTPVATLHVSAIGERVDSIPRRLSRVLLHFTVSGEGVEIAQAERAVELAVTKYCSVRDSLREDIPVEWTVSVAPMPGAVGAD